MIRLFGQKVRLLREEAEISQTTLAEAVGLSERSRGYISEIESGRKMPTPDKVLRIAEFFGVTIDYLLRDAVPIMQKDLMKE